MVGRARLRGADHVHHALPGAVDRLRACRQDGHADRVLVLLDRRRRALVRLRALHPRSGVHSGPRLWRVRLRAQPLFRAARPAAGGGSRGVTKAGLAACSVARCYIKGMAKTATIRARVEPELKRGAEAVLKKIGLTSSEAINSFLAQVKLTKGLPFPVRVPNRETRRAIRDAQT